LSAVALAAATLVVPVGHVASLPPAPVTDRSAAVAALALRPHERVDVLITGASESSAGPLRAALQRIHLDSGAGAKRLVAVAADGSVIDADDQAHAGALASPDRLTTGRGAFGNQLRVSSESSGGHPYTNLARAFRTAAGEFAATPRPNRVVWVASDALPVPADPSAASTARGLRQVRREMSRQLEAGIIPDLRGVRVNVVLDASSSMRKRSSLKSVWRAWGAASGAAVDFPRAILQ
jgi:hypothetical protein